MPLLTISRNVQHTQSYGCWLCIHVRLTAIYFHRPRLPKRWDDWQGIRIEGFLLNMQNIFNRLVLSSKAAVEYLKSLVRQIEGGSCG